MFEEAGEFADWSLDSEDGLTYDVIRRWKKKNDNSFFAEDGIVPSFR